MFYATFKTILKKLGCINICIYREKKISTDEDGKYNQI